MIKYSKELEEFCKENGISLISINGKIVYRLDTDRKEEEGECNE